MDTRTDYRLFLFNSLAKKNALHMYIPRSLIHSAKTNALHMNIPRSSIH